ncbi:hypothetical protein [Cohaesibacter gelatinilyticus]|uniref:Uncharacterized protein n=1 Tax=Cohaesibacter gelatinilyticus TaxID=372072 RepID=A0A285NDD0_9HYPH|nr:hypothetical protein [Cohaesibacter gelatinilyticus]SNZ07439.1 hypothetical protein SAMN06265368_0960 [Cohaesibacter gelatinilyticus]
MKDALNPQITPDDKIQQDNNEQTAISEQTREPVTCLTTNSDCISGPISFYPILLISAENLSEVKTSNDAALKQLESALSLIKTLDPAPLSSIGKEIAMMAEAVSEVRLFNEQYRRCVERVKETMRSDAKLGNKDVRDQISKHLREALVHSEQIDFCLCPQNNSEHLYSPEMGVFIDEILKNI